MERSQAKFFTQDIIHVFLKLDSKSSRQALTEATGLGEGSIRSILDILKQRGLIESSKQGHVLTNNGEAWHKRLSATLRVFETGSHYFPGYYHVGFHIRQPITPRQSYTLRDIAVRWGAEGALIFHFDGKELVLPPSKTADYNEDFGELRQGMENGDCCVLLYGANKPDLFSGGLAITAELSKTFGEFLDTLNL